MPSLVSRGRSRDVSPIAALHHNACLRIAFTFVPPSNLPHHDRPPYHSPLRHSPSISTVAPRATSTSSPRPQPSSSRRPSLSPPPAPHLPLPSTSPVDSLLQRSNSSSTLASTSPAATPPGPLTPPEYDDLSPQYPALSMPLDYYDSPPSPPRSLQDQMQVAYAFENMHLAKVLLLKLQGIEVSGDDDPRIAAVKDEDFHHSFVPSGSLPLDEADERRFREGERRERERLKRRKREERLRAIERLWEGSTQRMREERAKVVRKREEQARQRRRAEIDARERARAQEAREREEETLRQARVLRVGNPNLRPLLRYDTLADTRTSVARSPPRPTDDELFQFALMPAIPRRSSSGSCSVSPPDKGLSLSRIRRELARQHEQTLSHSVPFSDVIVSMHGPLFPEDSSRTEMQPTRSPAQMELLGSLFKVVEWEEHERVLVKGKSRAEPQRAAAAESKSACAACSLGASTVSSSATTITRTNSWFSIGSRTSVSTTLTTPSTSPLSLEKVPAQPLTLTSNLMLPEPLPLPLHHSCQQLPLSRVPVSEHPLSPPAPQPRPKEHPATTPETRGRLRTRGPPSQRSTSSSSTETDAEKGLVHRVSRSVSSLFDLAAQLQRAYVRATLITVCGTDAHSRSSSPSRSRSPSSSSAPHRARRLRAEGYRAPAADVQLFLAVPADAQGAPAPTRTLIPLAAPGAGGVPARVFALPAAPPRSPFRTGGTARALRLRPVANPVLLRLQALQNVCVGRALAWEGRAREGRMCAGREKLLGVAWEGIGRSGLGWEVAAGAVC